MQARFSRIKAEILRRIEVGEMCPGDKVASENQLAEQYGVSRMTARRALTELVDEGFLLRAQGLGTFVSDHRPMSSMLQIRSIKEEIQQRGHKYHNEVLDMRAVDADEQTAVWLGVDGGAQVFLSQVVHFESGLPVQYEHRLVNPAWAPQYLHQNLTQVTANEYLNQVAPLTEADHSVEAMLSDAVLANQLAMSPGEAVLKISRRTFSHKGIVSYAQLYHPGNRYRLGGHLDF